MPAGRQTLMRPHLIRPLLARGHFPGPDPETRYRAAQQWLRENVKGRTKVDRPTAAKAIAMIRAAGGKSFLAHPGYYAMRGMDIENVLERLKGAFLDGVEADYAYHKPHSPEFPDTSAQEEMVRRIKAVAARLGLALSAGSDGHDEEGVRYFHRMYPG
jgi:predicted metal-dependent phosphoesterase TrpH